MEDKRESRRRRRPSPTRQRVVGVIFILISLVVVALFLPGQLQRVREAEQLRTAGLPAQARVVAVLGCGRDWVNFTLRFTTARGETRTVTHDSYLLNCATHIQVGDSLAIRYAPDDPTLLLTQDEFNALPFAYFVYVLVDVVFLSIAAWMAWFAVLKPRSPWQPPRRN